MREDGLAMCSPGDDASSDRNERSIVSGSHQCEGVCRRVPAVESVSVRRNTGCLQGFELLATRLEDKVQLLCHAAAVLDSPVCLRYASMNGSMAPSITFCTSGIFSSVRWSLTIVYG